VLHATKTFAALFAASARWADAATLTTLALIGALIYGGMLLALFGPRWRAALRARATQ
jgi:hypothetical protein